MVMLRVTCKNEIIKIGKIPSPVTTKCFYHFNIKWDTFINKRSNNKTTKEKLV